MSLTIKQNTFGSVCYGFWYISDGSDNHLHKDLKIHSGTGYFAANHNPKRAQGYYKSKEEAKFYLKLFKEKNNMAEKIEVHLTVNDVVTPLHEISKGTLLKIREASKPKPVPAIQVAKTTVGGLPRLIFKVTEDIANRVGKYVGLEPNGIVGASFEDMADVDHYYRNRRELKLDEV